MSFKKSIVAFLLLFVVSNLLTTGWYMLTDDANSVSFQKNEINYMGLIANHLIFVAGFIYLFPNYIKDKNSKLNALWYGIVLAAIMFIPTGLVVRSIWQVSFDQIFILNTLAHLSIGGILGILLNSVFNYKRNEAN